MYTYFVTSHSIAWSRGTRVWWWGWGLGRSGKTKYRRCQQGKGVSSRRGRIVFHFFEPIILAYLVSFSPDLRYRGLWIEITKKCQLTTYNKNLLALIDEALNGLGSARYVQATVTTTTTQTVTAPTATASANNANVNTGVPFHCWTCNAASSITDCQNSGSNVECNQGDYGGCMVEMSVESGTLRQITMGCKQPQACEMQKSVNFWDFLQDATLIAAREAYTAYHRFTVCKPETQYNSYQPRSKCTQCCTHDNCFNTTGYTNGSGTTTSWADIQANWGRTEWKSTL